MEEKRLFLLDAYALIYRAYYALLHAPRVTSKGLNTSAIFGFCNSLDEILRKENPSHIAVCFDPTGPTFRHEAYADYKAGRDKQPEDITLAVPYIKEILAAYRIPIVEVAGYEADDVIGTISRMAEAQGLDTYMMTLDKDYGQLVSDHVFMYRPPLKGEGYEIRGPQQVCERYGIDSPHQVIDILALEGDKSDNVPGCPGIGPTTASKLIREWGSVDNLIANVGSLKGATKKKIEENVEQILFSKMLVTIRTDVPLPEGLTVDSLRREPLDRERLVKVWTELEFRTFINRLNLKSPTSEAPAPVVNSTGAQGSLFDFDEATGDMAPAVLAAALDRDRYRTASSIDEVRDAITRSCSKDAVGISFTTAGKKDANAMELDWTGFAVAPEPGEAVAINFTSEAMAEAVMPLFGSKTTLVGDDLKSLMLLVARRGVEWTAPYFDTGVAHYLIEPEMRHGLDRLAPRYLSVELSEADEAAMMSCERADAALRLMPVLSEQIEANGQRRLLDDIELPLERVLARMEMEGVRIDVNDLATLSEAYTDRLTAMEREAYCLAGEEFNIGSPTQVGEILFGKLHIDPKAKRTKKGAYSTTEEILSKYRYDYPIVDLILKVRALRKLLATYINALPAMINPRTGRIHTCYNQTVTATGRISSTNPNLQNIPIRSDDGREIRRAFVPDPGCLMLSADYSQIELRLMANMSGDPDMIEAFVSGNDFHRATAAKIYHLPVEEVTDNQRRNAKTANFGIIYGISAFGLSERLGIPRSEAKQLIDGYFSTYKGVSDYINRAIADARDQGYVTTVMGRKRMLPDINSRSAVVRGFAERNAVNAPLQGSAADIIKLAMIRIDRHISEAGLKSKMLMQVHDELVFNIVPEELEQMKQIIVSDMESAYEGKVPLEVSVGVGHNWLESH